MGQKKSEEESVTPPPIAVKPDILEEGLRSAREKLQRIKEFARPRGSAASRTEAKK